MSAYIGETIGNDEEFSVMRNLIVFFVSLMALVASAEIICKYCGQKQSTVQELVALPCIRHPAGVNKGKHALFEGSETETFTCIYCGQQKPSIATLVALPCPRHPNGVNKGRHSAYEGMTRAEYVCKYCGQKRPSIQALVSLPCPRHPNGINKGRHVPAR